MLAAMGEAAAAGAAPRAAAGLSPQAINVRQIPGVITAHLDASTACVLPDGTNVSWFHCYTPDQIGAAYGVDSVAAIPVGGETVPNYGQGQTIVLVDSYGSPTAAADLRHFHDTYAIAPLGAHRALGSAASRDPGRAGLPEPVQGDLRRDQRHATGDAVLDVTRGHRAGIRGRGGGADGKVRPGVQGRFGQARQLLRRGR